MIQAKIMECLIVPATRMTLGIEVGKGNFGKVYSGLLRMPDQDKPIGCAIKTLKGSFMNILKICVLLGFRVV